MSVVVLVTLAFITALAAFFRAWVDHRELKSTIASLERQSEEMQRKLSLRGRLAGEIAHEIKNPITAIQCSAETLDLMIGAQMAPELRKSLRYIGEYSEYLLRLLSDFLEVSRCEAGVNKPQAEIIEVRESVEAVTGLLRSYAMRKRINLSFESIEPGVLAFSDSRHFKQIIFNLVHNGLKFTPENGTIELSAESPARGRFVSIRVKDSGCGIPGDKINSIFDPYSRFEGESSSFDSGVGLGLALCRNLVELNGGRITVESVLGQGSTFTVFIPKAHTIRLIKPAEKQDAVNLPTLFQPLLGQNFLVVDQDPSARESLAKLIQGWGGMVDQVAQAVEAVEAISSKAYDAVMVDSSRDGLNGYEVASLLKDNAHTQGTTIILTTDNAPDENLALESGADRTIEKPLQGDRLLRSLITAGKCQISH